MRKNEHAGIKFFKSGRRTGKSLFQQGGIFGVLMLLLFFLTASSGLAFDFAPLNPEFVKYMEEINKGRFRSNVTVDGHGLGLIPSPIDFSHAERTRRPVGQLSASLPSTYDLRTTGKLTDIRDQGDCGACWAFATYSSLESWLMPSENRDFSEQNLNDEHGFDFAPCGGGTAGMAIAYLASWSGPVNESDDPYQFSAIPIQKHIQKAVYVPRTQYTFGEIKQAIMNYGAVFTTMRAEELDSTQYYNESNNSYYYNGTDESDHAVAIVGWDDNFSKSNFIKTPPGDGAFIIRNSWGTSFGDGGYFYMSYYDTYAGYGCWAFHNAESTDNYLEIYEYDELGMVGQLGTGSSSSAWGANVFQARATATLSAVSSYAVSSNTSYVIKIYTGVTAGSPSSGTLALTQSGTLSEIGYHTIKLSQPVSLTAGQLFSITIQFNTPGFNYPIPTEYAVSGYSSKAECHSGESYFSTNGTSWTEISSPTYKNNACIKAFTSQSVANQPVLSVNPATCNVSSGAGTTAYTVSNTGSGTMSWSAQVISGSSWLQISSGASGSNSGTINCSFSANTDTAARTGTIRITASGATGSPKDVTVSQAGAESGDCISDWVSQNPPQGNITAQEASDIDCIFDAIESLFPDLMYPPTDTIIAGSMAYRSYTTTGAYLLAWKTDTLKVVYLGPLSEYCPLELGTVDDLKALLCQSPDPGITAGLWSGSNIQFNVSSDGSKITSTGSSIEYNGKDYSISLGPTTATNVGACGSVKMTLYLNSDLSISNNQFSGRASDGSITVSGTFNSSTSSSGSYSLNVYISECSAYFKSTESWMASPSGTTASTGIYTGTGQQYTIEKDGMIVVMEFDPN